MNNIRIWKKKELLTNNMKNEKKKTFSISKQRQK